MTLAALASVVAAIVLFIYGLEGFSREMQAAGAGAFARIAAALTRDRWRGFALGTVLTVVIQSSTAVSSIVVALVDSGAITFRNSLAVLLGAKVGTTSTAWLVSFKLTGIGPIFVVLGTVLGFLPHKLRVFGRAVFYFGFVLLTLDLISESLTPLRSSPWVATVLGSTTSLPLVVLAGVVVTVLVQSSSVTSGLAVVLAQQNAIAPEAGIAIVIGASLGTTVTSLVASAKMQLSARRAARANTLFNVLGVTLMLPFVGLFARGVLALTSDPARAVALAQLLFNLGLAVPFLVLLRPYERLVLRLWPGQDERSATIEQ